MMRPAALALFLALAGSGGSSRYSAHAFSSIPPPRQPPAPSNTPPPMDPAGQFDDTRGPTAGSPSGYGGGSGTGPGTDAAPPSASQEPSLSPPSSSRQQYSSSTARTTRTIGQPLIRRSTREEGFHSGTWWEEAAGAGDVRRGSAGNFQTYTDQQRRMARGEPFSVYDGGNVSRRTRSASGWADGRRPDRGTTTAGVRGQHNERSAAESAHNSWWDNPGSGQGTRGAGYGTQGNFKTYTDLQKEQQGGGGGRGNN